MKYARAVIYFLSGTGNSYRVASWLHEACASGGMASSLVPLDLADPKNEITASPDTLVALAWPTHGLMPPWSAIKFLLTMPVKRRAHAFILPTRGCFHIGPVPIPGAAGLASIFPMLFLPLKGYSMRGAVSFDMPVNMSNMHPRITDRGIAKITERARRKADRNFSLLLRGKRRIFTRNNLYELLWSVPLLCFMPTFPVAYLLVGRFFMGKIMFANYNCVGCGLCARSCAAGAIVMKGKARPRPYWRYNCEDCLRCMAYCPHRAVEAGHSWAALLLLITSFPASTRIFGYLAGDFPAIAPYRSALLLDGLNFFFYYPMIIIAYILFFHALSFKPFNALFTYTTLTHWFRRYREPHTSLKDLTERADSSITPPKGPS